MFLMKLQWSSSGKIEDILCHFDIKQSYSEKSINEMFPTSFSEEKSSLSNAATRHTESLIKPCLKKLADWLYLPTHPPLTVHTV